MSVATVNLNALADFQPSLCIPRVFHNITESKIRRVFNELGFIRNVDIKQRYNEKGEVCKKVYIHFDKWFWNEKARYVREEVMLGNEVKVVYDEPWYWKVSALTEDNRLEHREEKQVDERPRDSYYERPRNEKPSLTSEPTDMDEVQRIIKEASKQSEYKERKERKEREYKERTERKEREYNERKEQDKKYRERKEKERKEREIERQQKEIERQLQEKKERDIEIRNQTDNDDEYADQKLTINYGNVEFPVVRRQLRMKQVDK
jgi:hypothetical protein